MRPRQKGIRVLATHTLHGKKNIYVHVCPLQQHKMRGTREEEKQSYPKVIVIEQMKSMLSAICTFLYTLGYLIILFISPIYSHQTKTITNNAFVPKISLFHSFTRVLEDLSNMNGMKTQFASHARFRYVNPKHNSNL